ncbi:esterase-like activity of phytase family protein [Chamaesiphon sp.]|uniref:esterase-like activity of phytase family protein n=1 Tax=Chamaesiphon sp. TaxID=2814140 RepID=UPI0035934EF9
MATINGTANNDVLFIDKEKSNDTLLGLAGNDYLDALPGAGNNSLRGGAGDDELYAYLNDQLFGDAGNDKLSSDGNGNNILSGGDGNDLIFADRNDLVSGDAGDDTIYGGQGGNTITGGTGKDIFLVANVDVPTTPNTITDFDRLNDTVRINLAGVTNFSDLTVAKSGNDATVSFGTQQLVLLKNTAPGSLNSNTVAVGINAPNNVGSNVTSYDFTNLPKLGTTSKGQDILLGGFSGLYFQGIAANGNLKFVTHTDRGPNGEPTGANRPFYLPSFQPEIVSFELNRTSGEIGITKRTGLFRADGTTALTGLPNLQAAANGLAYTDEIGVDLDGKVLANDSLGADVEGIVVAPNGDYWLVDEYRPAIYHFDVNGKLLNRFIPKGTATAPAVDLAAGTFGTEVLPEVYAQRRSNRGFEAVAIEGTKLYAFIQSPIDNPDNAGDTASRASRTVRILEFDTVTKAVTGEYLYLLDDITGAGTAKTDKIGDAVSLGGGKFAVVERDDLATTASNKLIYQIDLAGATNISNPANFTLPTGKTIEQLTPAELTTAKIATVSKSLIANAAQLGYTGVEKLEGLALVAPNTLALINDNDFNVVAGSKVPSKLGILELSKNLPITGAIVNKSISATDPANLNLGANDSYTKITGDNRANIIDASTGGGNNQLFGGEGADELYAYQNDRLFGEGGNDILDATDGKGGNRLDGGIGDDTLFAGSEDLLSGGDGNDTLFAGDGGNTLTGDNGKDTFILAVATLPTTANIITDFKAGTDTLKIAGIPGIDDDLTKLTAIVQGSDTLLKAGTVDLALLKGIQANSIAEVLNPTANPNPNPNLTPIAGISLNKNLFIADATIKGLGVNAVSQKAGNKVNEIGFFAVDDITGKIGSITPGAAGYLKLAIDSAKPIFSTLHGSFFNTNKREIGLDPNKTYQFFKVQDGSIADLQQQIASGKTPTNILFALPDMSGNSPFKFTTNNTNDGYNISVNNDELILNVSRLAGATPNVPIGAKSQGLLQGRILDLTEYAGKTLKADVTTTSEAGYNNNIAFYAVEDAILGTIKTAAGTIIKPGDANYAAEAIKSALLQVGKTDSKLNQDLIGGKVYAPVLIAQGTLADFASKNPTNGGDGNVVHAYFNYLGANPDKLDHFRLLGNNTFGVEDLYGSGDRDFNDVVININIKTA